jgi:hypothetical protein
VSCSVTLGLHRDGEQLASPGPPLSLLEAISRLPPRTMVSVDGFEIPVEFPAFVHVVAAMASGLRAKGSTMIVHGSPVTIPPVLARELIVLEVPLPGPGDLTDLARDIASATNGDERRNEDAIRAVVRAAQGLTHAEARDAFAKTIQYLRPSAYGLEVIRRCRQCSLAKRGLIEIDPVPGERTDSTGSAVPSSLLLTGDDGRGRDVRPREIAARWTLPLLRLDTDKMVAPYTYWDANLRKAIHAAEAAAPVVLWIDEIELWMPASAPPDARDARNAASMAAAFVRWMRERTAPICVVATAVRLDAALPQLLAADVFGETISS